MTANKVLDWFCFFLCSRIPAVLWRTPLSVVTKYHGKYFFHILCSRVTWYGGGFRLCYLWFLWVQSSTRYDLLCKYHLYNAFMRKQLGIFTELIFWYFVKKDKVAPITWKRKRTTCGLTNEVNWIRFVSVVLSGLLLDHFSFTQSRLQGLWCFTDHWSNFDL